ncbi:LapA family protein [Amphibacillus jilinensis]|uniref:LapA family protein n=1 Tax=Amphibacillus jilinensis TaxID=1216008 RepID=UPI0003149B27|nr:lipopolysaccharide assembly protein LapA domain-containing protein [Amphibacillus jilinensis]
MKGQTYIISALVFALIVAIFAVINVEPVEVNYLFTTAESPLILIILVSTLLGGLITGGFSIYHLIGVRKTVRQLEAENTNLKNKLSIDEEQESIEVNPEVTKSDPIS